MFTAPTSPTSSAIDSPAPAGRRRAAILLLWLVALVVGASLRLPHLLAETPHYDEWHPLLAVKRQNLEKIATTFGKADRSLPVSIYAELLTRSIGLSDLALRLPFAVTGLALLIVLPLAIRRRSQPDAVAPMFALMLAISPLLVYYSRAIRPYGVATLCALLAVLALRRALAPDGRRWVWAYVASAALVGWTLPVFFPFAVVPLAGEFLSRWRRQGFAAAKPALGIGLRLGAVLLVLLGPALWRDSASLSEKTGSSGFDLFGLLATPRVLCGTHSWLLMALWLSAVVWGGVVAWRRSDKVLQPLILACGGQIAAVAVAQPYLIDEAIVLTRYLLPVGVVGWLLVCDLLQRKIALLAEVRRDAAAVVGALAVGLVVFLSGPLHGWLHGAPDNFASTRLHNQFWAQKSVSSGRWPPLPPESYARFESLPPRSAAVLEVPYSGYLAEPYGYYQLTHRQEVFLGVTADFCARRNTIELPPFGSRGFKLARFVALGDLEGMRRRGIRFVVLHRHTEKKVGEVYLKNTFFDFDKCVGAFAALSGVVPEIDDRIAFFDLGAR